MIGGNDVVLPAVGDSASMEGCARIVSRYWRDIRFEDAATGNKYSQLCNIPFGRVRELLMYRDAKSEAAWDADSPDSPENSMLNLIIRTDDMTVVLDNPNTAEMQSILNTIRDWLWNDILLSYARAA